jgi:hypothetical protein
VTNFIKSLWRRRWFRGCAWTVAALCAIGILLRQYIDWSGARSWAAAQKSLARAGESIDLRKVAPDPVPDQQNFLAIPPLKDLALSTGGTDDARYTRLIDAMPRGAKGGSRPPLSGGASTGWPANLWPWAAWLRANGWQPASPDSGSPARDVLAALSRDDSLAGELAAGLSRPESQWTPSWKTRVLPDPLFMVALPHYTAAQSLTSMLGLRAVAAARAGDAAKAQQSLLIAVRIDQAFIQEPLLIGTLVAAGCSAVITNAVWELCDARAGTADQFRTLEEQLSRLDLKKSLLHAERGELAFGANAIAYLKRTRDARMFGFDRDSAPASEASLALRLAPGGWFDATAATLAEWEFDYFIEPLRNAGFTELLAKQRELDALIGEHRSRYYEYPNERLALVAMPGHEGVTQKVVYIQSVLNQAVAACALERYRIEHGAYPDTLDAASQPGEKSIPLDILSGKPMGYRKTADGSYALWCVGFNGIDHGGKRAVDPNEPRKTKFWDPQYTGDWVWDFPPGGAPAAAQ